MEPNTINDLDEDDFEHYKSNYIKKHYALLNSKFTFVDRFCIRLSLCHFLKNWLSLKKFESCISKEKNETTIKYSKNLYVPKEIAILMEVIKSKDLTTKGIFRIKPDSMHLNNVEEHFITLIINKDVTINEFLNREDIITLTALFARVFNHFKNPLLPRRYLTMCYKAFIAENELDRIQLLRAVFLGMDYDNRAVFESLSLFIKMCSEVQVKNDPAHVRSMDFNGIVSMFAAQIMSDHGLNSENIMNFKNYVEMLIFIFKNMESILLIENE